MIADPATAAPRPDLVFLRRRARPRRPAPPAQPTATQPTAAQPTAAQPTAAQPTATQPGRAAAGGGVDYTHHGPPAAPSAAPAARSVPRIDFSRPDRHPATPPSAPAASGPAASATPASRPATSATGRVEFSRPERSGSSSGALDLSDPAPAAASRRPAGPAPRVHEDARVGGHGQHLLGPDSPTVTLTRVQSGVGHLTIEAMCSAEVGDLRLGALYQLRSGGTSTVQHAGGNRFAPSSRRPVVVAGREEYERLGIDLRQVGDVERLGVYAFSESRTALTWGGTLVLTLFGGARVELPLESLRAGTVAVLLSIYNLDGELVLRTEMETIDGDIREAARAYGYDRITWRDDRTPVD